MFGSYYKGRKAIKKVIIKSMRKKKIKNQLRENLREFEKELFSHKQSGDETIEQKNKYDKLVDELASNYKEVLNNNPDV